MLEEVVQVLVLQENVSFYVFIFIFFVYCRCARAVPGQRMNQESLYLRVNGGDQMSGDSEQGFSSIHPFNLGTRVLRQQEGNRYCAGS